MTHAIDSKLRKELDDIKVWKILLEKSKRTMMKSVFRFVGILCLIASTQSLFMIVAIKSNGINTWANITELTDPVSCGFKSFSKNCYQVGFQYHDDNGNLHTATKLSGNYQALSEERRLIKITYSQKYPKKFVIDSYLLGEWMNFIVLVLIGLLFVYDPLRTFSQKIYKRVHFNL